MKITQRVVYSHYTSIEFVKVSVSLIIFNYDGSDQRLTENLKLESLSLFMCATIWHYYDKHLFYN